MRNLIASGIDNVYRSNFSSGDLLGVAKIAHQEIRVPPVFLNLNPGSQVNLGAHKLLTIGSCERRNFLQHGTMLTDDDALMTGLFTVNCSINVNYTAVAL